tara:strand:- start:4259 stop:4540 length:282 start_codon:yes stop_codon:yes gene_type:complete
MAEGHAWLVHELDGKKSAIRITFVMENEMPKLKTKSGAKKRFRATGTGKILHNQAYKRHGMSKRPRDMLRNSRGTTTLCAADAKIVKKFLPYL